MSELRATELLQGKFGPGPESVIARAPGRVNLIGEHTDYNKGYVLPFAIDRYTEVAIRPRIDRKIHVYTAAVDETLSIELPLKSPKPQGRWSDYLVGILQEFSELGSFPHGFDAAIWGNVPLGAGLSSSASLEVAFAVALVRLYELEMDGLELVKLCQRAEGSFVGMPCGIMDQYTAYFGEAGQALLLDTRALEHEAVPLDLEGITLVVVDSGVRRALAGSGYAVRRRECEEATHWLAQRFPGRGIRALRDVDQKMLEMVRGEMPETLWKRARHVVEENARVLAMVKALERGDSEEVGRLLFSSHASLRDLFEVSIPEIDFLVDWGLEHGAMGARLVGGGFGGVTLHLVPVELKEKYIAEIKKAYWERFRIGAKVVEVRPGSGAKYERGPDHR